MRYSSTLVPRWKYLVPGTFLASYVCSVELKIWRQQTVFHWLAKVWRHWMSHERHLRKNQTHHFCNPATNEMVRHKPAPWSNNKVHPSAYHHLMLCHTQMTSLDLSHVAITRAPILNIHDVKEDAVHPLLRCTVRNNFEHRAIQHI